MSLKKERLIQRIAYVRILFIERSQAPRNYSPRAQARVLITRATASCRASDRAGTADESGNELHETAGSEIWMNKQ